MYNTIQVLRGLAALLVVLNHAWLVVGEHRIGVTWNFDWAACGVDLFFPISGFVMVVSTRRAARGWRSAAAFVRKRLIRVVPLYWALTTAKVLALLLVPAFALHAALFPWHTAASYLFVPALNPQTGRIAPVLADGWTLSCEMFFYVVFAAALAVSRRPAHVAALALCGASVLGLFVIPAWGALGTIFSPIDMEFVFGVVAGLVVVGKRPLPARTAIALALGALLAFALLDPRAGGLSVARPLVWGLPCAALVLAAATLERRWGGRITAVPLLLGDASYSIYLTHSFVLPAVAALWNRLAWRGTAAAWAAELAATAVALLVGVATWICVERPVTAWLRKLPQRRRWPEAAERP